MMRLAGSVIWLALATVGCFGTPSPLAPGLRGSVGVPHYGVQTDARELAVEGTGFVRYRPYSSNYWGNPRLVTAIERAAAEIWRSHPGGEPLVVGDLSARSGGKIPRHNSHRTGRDVDFLWYMTTPNGAPVRAPGFVNIGADGLAKLNENTFVRLDVERQWALFRELLTDPFVDVQFLFVSREVEALLIDYALARETDLELVWHAETVMLQPGDSAPHADHVHVRIACTPEEAVYGCEGGGPRWEWLEPLPYLDAPTTELMQRIREEDPFLLPPIPPEPSPMRLAPDPSLSRLLPWLMPPPLPEREAS